MSKFNKITKRVLLGAMFCLGTLNVSAQQEGQYTQYMYNTQVFNPGYVGTTRNASISVLHRQQWAGLEGAPQTSTLTINAPLKKGLGIGGSVMHDALGISSETHATIDLAYRLKLNRKYTLSMGMKAGINSKNTDFTELNVFQTEEPNSFQRVNELLPTAGAGMFFYSEQMYVGLSAPNLVQNKSNFDQTSLRHHEVIHANLIAGYVFKFNSVQFKPAGLIKYVKGAPMNWQLSTNVMFNEKFTAGLAYQSNSSASVLLGLHLKRRAFIGYSYDMALSSLRSFGLGSHEIFLSIKLGNVNNTLKSPRFF